MRMLRATFCWELAIMALIAAEPRAIAQSLADKEIAEVRVEGNRLRTTEQILAKMETKAGRRYNVDTAQKDVSRLLDQGWFPPYGVSLFTQERLDGRITVIVVVRELPKTIQKITYRGADHFGAEEIEKLTGLKKGDPMSKERTQSARNALIRAYQEKSRLWADVKIVKGEQFTDDEVIFDVSEGPSVKVGSVKFEFFGPTSGDITTGRLRTKLQSSKAILGLIGGDFNPIQLDMDVVALTEYYRNLGYLFARVQRELIWSENHRSVTIVFHVEEGARYKIGKVQIDGNKTNKEIELLGYTDLREGDYYDKFIIQNDIKRLRDFYGFKGRPVTVRESYHYVGEGEVNVHYQIEEKEPQRVKEVLIYNNGVTKDSVIRRQVGIYPGQILSFPDLLQAQNNLSRLGIFEEDPAKGIKPTVEVENPDVDEPFKTILVRVTEKPTGSFMIGAGVTSDAGLTGSVVINERNFDITRWPTSFDDILEGRAWRGAGQEFRIEAVPGTTFQRYTVSFREPYLFDSRYSFGASGYYFERAYNEYTEARIGGRFTWGRRLDQNWSINFTERVEQVEVSNIPYGAPPAITDYQGWSNVFGQRLNLTYDARDNVLRPTSGEIADVGAEYVLGNYQFPILTAEATKYWTTFQRKDGSGKQVVAFRSQVSWEGDNAPVFERFYAGGFRSMRGFAFRGVGPYENGFNVGGNFMWLNSLEYQIPVLANDNLYFVSFIDSGTVEQSVEIRDYRVTAGLGMRIAIPQLLGPVPLALDFGIPIVKGPYDNKQLFSFWLGFFN
jgi:outer membrane protein insertion porin family